MQRWSVLNPHSSRKQNVSGVKKNASIEHSKSSTWGNGFVQLQTPTFMRGGGGLAYVLSWYFTVSLCNTFSHSSRSSTNSCFHSLTAKEVGFCLGFYFLFKTLKRNENKQVILPIWWLQGWAWPWALSLLLHQVELPHYTSIHAKLNCVEVGAQLCQDMAAGSKPAHQCWLQLLAVEGQMKEECRPWNHVEFWKIRCLPVWSQDRVETEKAGHRSAASWEPSGSPCAHSTAHLALPDRGMLEAGRWREKCSLFPLERGGLPHAHILLNSATAWTACSGTVGGGQLWHCAPAATVCCHRPSQLRGSC